MDRSLPNCPQACHQPNAAAPHHFLGGRFLAGGPAGGPPDRQNGRKSAPKCFERSCVLSTVPVSLGHPEPHTIPINQTMRLSRYFLPILRETPKEAEIVSHRLMLRAGMMRQEAAGIYAWLPLGFRVLKKIEQIVREEQDRAGAIELLMPTLQLADLWRESGRYDAYGPEMLRIKDRHERELLYGPTNEDMITEIFRAYVRSYRDLPKNLYHIQWKFRDEQRPRFGVMRGREFLMKDAYSFDIDEAAARVSYNKMFVAYLRTFARMGLKAIPMRAETGPIGGDLSARIHHPRRDRRIRRVLQQGCARLAGARRGRRLRRRSRADHPAMDRRSMPRPTTCTTRSASSARCRRTSGCTRAASRSGRSSISAPNIRCR